MACSISTSILKLLFLASLLQAAMAARKLTGEDDDSQSQSSQLFKYHNGALLSGKISVNLIWYGNFKPSQKAIITDFIASLASPPPPPSSSQPSVAAWWKQMDKYYRISSSSNSKKSSRRPLSLALGPQVSDKEYSLGKHLTDKQITLLASKGQLKDAINIVLTASDVVVAGQCMSRCGSHGSGTTGHVSAGSKRLSKFAYIWVGNSETQCPGQCAWPFHQPIYGPQSPPLVAPNNDIGLDGMVINVASLLAGTVTNPFKNGFFQGPQDAPLEAASARPGVYGSGAYPGYAGNLLVDSTTRASYNANGVNGRKYLLPALFDPSTSSCSTLV